MYTVSDLPFDGTGQPIPELVFNSYNVAAATAPSYMDAPGHRRVKMIHLPLVWAGGMLHGSSRMLLFVYGNRIANSGFRHDEPWLVSIIAKFAP